MVGKKVLLDEQTVRGMEGVGTPVPGGFIIHRAGRPPRP